MVLVALISGATTIAVLTRTRDELTAAAVSAMQSRIEALRHVYAVRLDVATTNLAGLVRSDSFENALTARNLEALRTLLGSYAATIRGQFAFVLGPDGKPFASSPSSLTDEADEDFSAAIRAQQAHPIPGSDPREFAAVIGGQAYRLALVPLPNHANIWVGAAFHLDDNAALRLKDVVGLELTFMARDATGRGQVSTSLPRELKSSLYGLNVAELTSGDPATIELGGEKYLTAAIPLESVRGRIDVIAQQPLRETLTRFAHLRLEMLSIAGAALAAAALLIVLLSRRALRPIDELVRAAQRIEQGHYGEPVTVRGGREFEHLAAVFDGMQKRIAERESRIVHQAKHDQLTGLPNRFAARMRLASLLQSGEPVGVVLLDLRDFKHLNASFGHELGDQVLRELARRLLGAMRAGDFAARLGADQFLLLLRGSTIEQAESTALQIVRGSRQGFLLGAIEVNLNVFAGLAAAPEHGTDADELLQRVDIALQETKASGARVCRYERGHDERYRRRLRLLSDLHAAIVGDQLSLVFQPKVLMADRRVRSLEALVRWTHPQLGAISPSEFVPLAEQTGAIGELTRWVLRSAIEQLASWRVAGLESEVAVNLSASDLANPELPDEILGMLARADVLPHQLQLEITESAIMRELDKSIRAMRRLRDAGVRFAIDDFGTGHSSLAQLKALPVDEIKIDRSFVRDLVQGTRDDAIVRSAVELAHSLGLKVVAEGIETPAAWTALLHLGCDYAQGYFISRPLPPEQVSDWIRELNARLAGAESGTAQVRVLTEFRSTRR